MFSRDKPLLLLLLSSSAGSSKGSRVSCEQHSHVQRVPHILPQQAGFAKDTPAFSYACFQELHRSQLGAVLMCPAHTLQLHV
jgi:hypothetical protein